MFCFINENPGYKKTIKFYKMGKNKPTFVVLDTATGHLRTIYKDNTTEVFPETEGTSSPEGTTFSHLNTDKEL